MKLKNKKTGEIVDVESLGHADSLKGKFGYQVTLSWKIDEHLDTCKTYNSLAELNEEWEDAPEEPKEYWYIEPNGVVARIDEWDCCTENDREVMKLIGNYFSSKEEAEKAVEKLKAWKRLKDKGFRFKCWYGGSKNIDWEITSLENETYIPRQICDDLDLLFSEEDD